MAKTRDLAGVQVDASFTNRGGGFDPAAEDQVAREFGPRIYLMALVRTGNADAARDLSQSALLEVLQALRKGQLRDRGKLPAFVFGTARNVINYYLRAQSRVPRPEQLDLDHDACANAAQPHDLEQAERVALMRRAVARLEPGDRQILTMTMVEGLEPVEIATRLGLSSEVVRQRKSRAIKRAIDLVKKLSRG